MALTNSKYHLLSSVLHDTVCDTWYFDWNFLQEVYIDLYFWKIIHYIFIKSDESNTSSSKELFIRGGSKEKAVAEEKDEQNVDGNNSGIFCCLGPHQYLLYHQTSSHSKISVSAPSFLISSSCSQYQLTSLILTWSWFSLLCLTSYPCLLLSSIQYSMDF